MGAKMFPEDWSFLSFTIIRQYAAHTDRGEQKTENYKVLGPCQLL